MLYFEVYMTVDCYLMDKAKNEVSIHGYTGVDKLEISH